MFRSIDCRIEMIAVRTGAKKIHGTDDGAEQSGTDRF